jgi:SAM-dependent methyltransferase
MTVPAASLRRSDRDARSANRRMYGHGGMAHEYLDDPYHLVRRQAAVALLDRALPGGHAPVLELACGSRPMLREPTLRGSPVIVGDIALAALASLASPELDDRTTGRRAICLDAADPLPLRDASLAALLIGELIEHLFDPLSLLRECRRVLQPGGVLVLTTPNLATLQDRLRFAAGHAPRHVNPMHPYLSLHIRPFTARSLAQTLRHTGFEPIELRSNFVCWRLPNARWLRSRTFARLAPALGGSLVVAARASDTAHGL